MISEHSAFQPIAIEYPFQKRHDKRHPPRLWVSRRQSGWFERVSIVPCPLSWPHCGVTVWWWKQILVRFIGFWNDFNEIVQIISITITVMMNCVDAFVLFNQLSIICFSTKLLCISIMIWFYDISIEWLYRRFLILHEYWIPLFCINWRDNKIASPQLLLNLHVVHNCQKNKIEI